MTLTVDNLIIGQGIAGSAVAWTLHWAGQSVLIVDRGESDSASRVSAGLVTPATGRRFVKPPDYDNDWNAAVTFYRKVEAATGQPLFTEQQMIRLGHDHHLLENSDSDIAAWSGPLLYGGGTFSGVTMAPAGRLDVQRYLQATAAFFQQHDSYRLGELNENDLLPDKDGIYWQHADVCARRVVLCQGSTHSHWFPGVPNNPSRGDILEVRIPNYQRTEVVHRSIWIAPSNNDRPKDAAHPESTQTVGATYDWKFVDRKPSAAGRREIETKLTDLVGDDFEVLNHVSSVRPTMKDYQPVVGQHPTIHQLYILNGLGSKGTLRAPRLAALLRDAFLENQVIPLPVAYHRLLTPPSDRRPLTQVAQQAVAETLQPGDTAIDATVGNGFDTCFLSQTVGSKGTVIGFDIQQDAIESTEKRLVASGVANVRLILGSHEDIATAAQPNTISAVMFNLGFLPRSDRTVVTKPDSTVTAIQHSLHVLRPGGVLSVLCYRGHDGGPEEAAVVEQLLQTYADQHHLTRTDSTPAKPTSPVLFVLKKSETC